MMKKIIAALVFMVLGMGEHQMISAGEVPRTQATDHQEKNLPRGARREKRSARRHRKEAREEHAPTVASQESVEKPVENMATYISSFDHVAKQKNVDALLMRAIAFCKDNSLDAICHAFTHTQDFIEGSLYVFLLDTHGIVYAHGDQSQLLWKNLWKKKDMFGSCIVQSMIKLARSGGGSLTYEWDGGVKVSQIRRIMINDKEFVIGCGYYPHSKESAAIGLVKGAVELLNQYVKENKPASSGFSDMTYPLSPQFVFGDLYLYALDFDGTIVAQGERPGLIGSHALNYRDNNGKAYNKEIIEKLKNANKGEGVWVDYISKRALKRAYAEKVTDAEGKHYFIACGYYPEITKDTVIDLVRRGYQFMKGNGLTAAIESFNNGKEDPYRYGDIAMFMYDMKGKCLAHGKNADLIGQEQIDSKDEDGHLYVREIINQANHGGGWVNFKLNHSFQATYVEKVDLGVGNYVIGAGLFPVSKPETMEMLVKSALAYLNDHTMDQLLGRIVDRNDEFLRGDLYMYVFDRDGFCYAWADSYKLIWQNLLNWKDDNGKLFVKQMIDASSQGPEHLILRMNKCPRVNYFEQVEKDGKKYLIGSGFYK